jgi:hypothetical protein
MRDQIARQTARPAFYRKLLFGVLVGTILVALASGLVVTLTGGALSSVIAPLTLIAGGAALVVAIIAVMAAVAAYELATQGPALRIRTCAPTQPDDLIVVPVRYRPHAVTNDVSIGPTYRWTVFDLHEAKKTYRATVEVRITNAGLRTAKNAAVRMDFEGCELAHIPEGFTVRELSEYGRGAPRMRIQSEPLPQIHPGWDLPMIIAVDLAGATGRGYVRTADDQQPLDWLMQIEVVADDMVPTSALVPIKLAVYWADYRAARKRAQQRNKRALSIAEEARPQLDQMRSESEEIGKATRSMPELARAVHNNDYSKAVPKLTWLQAVAGTDARVLDDVQHGRAIPLDASYDQVQELIGFYDRAQAEYQNWRVRGQKSSPPGE